MILPRELLEEALVELIGNAIEADRPADRPAQVSLAIGFDRRDLIVDISDNGTGMAGVKPGTPLSDVDLQPTKGRPADGLVQVSNVLAYARGNATVVTTSQEGTHVRVRVMGRLNR